MIAFRHAEPGDLPAVGDLLYEVERFYGAVEFATRPRWEHQIASLLFSEAPAARVLLALDAGVAVAFASYSFLWPAAEVSKSLFLKELYVRAPYRRRGIGASLMSRLCSIAVETGCSRVEWATDTANADAQSFYEKLGAARATGKVMYRAEGDDLVRLSQLPRVHD